MIPVATTVYRCPIPTNGAVATALWGAVTVQDAASTTVYQCSAGQTITVGETAYTSAYTSSYTTQTTISSSAPSPIEAVSSQTIIYVQKTVSQGPTATSTQWVVVLTATPTNPSPIATTTIQVIPTLVPAACNGEDCVSSHGGNNNDGGNIGSNISGNVIRYIGGNNANTSTSSSFSATRSQPFIYTGAACTNGVRVIFSTTVFGLITFLFGSRC
jgi:hypothetical protein